MPSSSPCLPDTTPEANLTQRNAWTLDKLGNWDSLVKQVNSVSVTEPRDNNEANEYLTMDPDGSGGASPITLVHDDNGNLKDDGTYLYDYDIENRMTRVRLKAGPVLLADYHYDALGRRIRKIIPTGQPDAGTWTYAINEQWQVLSEYHLPTGEEETIPVREYCHAGQNAYVDDHVAMFSIYIDGEEVSENWHFYHVDAQFCTLAMTAWIGSVAERYVTDPYGKAVTYNGSWASPQATSRLGNPFMHQGLWLDGECGKYQNRHREFLLTVGRFAQRDPLKYYDGQSLYPYLISAPSSHLDPYGTAVVCDIINCKCDDGGTVSVVVKGDSDAAGCVATINGWPDCCYTVPSPAGATTRCSQPCEEITIQILQHECGHACDAEHDNDHGGCQWFRGWMAETGPCGNPHAGGINGPTTFTSKYMFLVGKSPPWPPVLY